jgi:hypothetical protein
VQGQIVRERGKRDVLLLGDLLDRFNDLRPYRHGWLASVVVRVAAVLDDRLPWPLVYPTEVNGFLDNSDKIGPISEFSRG